MARKSLTKDEQYLWKLRQLAEYKGDVCSPVCRYVVGSGIGANPKSVDAIVKHLAQTNFVKKGDGSEIYLTPNGLNLTQCLATA